MLATLGPDVVRMPGGLRPLKGDSAIRNFWWPGDGSRTRIAGYPTTVDEISGAPPFAYVRNTGMLTFVYEKDTIRVERTNRHMSLTVVRRESTGEWRIVRRMWANLAS